MTKPLLYTVFHLNLAFSSVEEEQRAEIVERCYWPLLRLAEDGIPIGIEATSYTLGEIQKISPEWISTLRVLLENQKLEFVGSGYCQIIAPLVAPEVTEWNLRLGLEDYEELLGLRPRIALINEQAYSRGILPLYKAAGFDAVIMDWAEPASHNKAWERHFADAPRLIAGSEGVVMPVIWSDAMTFQKFQRFAHGELSSAEYFEFLAGQVARGTKAIPIYTSDAEVFDFRPGRFLTETENTGSMEFERIRLLLASLNTNDTVQLVLPSDALQLLDPTSSVLALETPQVSVPVKKQRKYNVTRWGVTGRSDLLLNTHCWRRYEELAGKDGAEAEDWRELCFLWSSDFRTHITEKRWRKVISSKLATVRVERNPKLVNQTRRPADIAVKREGRFLAIETPAMHLVLNTKKGLAIQAFGYGPAENSLSGKLEATSVVGTLGHGFFDDIQYGADFYSGHLVVEPSSAHKIADLVPCEPTIDWRTDPEGVEISFEFDVSGAVVSKRILFEPGRKAITVSYEGDGLAVLEGSIRLGFATLNPAFFRADELFYAVHNGGRELEVFPLSSHGALLDIDHGKPVSRLVSATTGLGMTEGVLYIGDCDHLVGLEMIRSDCAGLGMVKSTPVDGTFFARTYISVNEQDETRKMTSVSELVDLVPLNVTYRLFLTATSKVLK